MTCSGSAVDLKTWRDLGGPRCGIEATHRTPDGPRCTSCARKLAEAAHAPNTILGIMLRDKMLPSIEKLLENWRIQ